MNKTEIFDKIKNASNAQVNAKEAERQRKIASAMVVYNKALTFLPRVIELCEIAEQANNCGYLFVSPMLSSCTAGKNPEFMTDGVNHRLGFYKGLRSIGNKAGGCDGMYDFVVTSDDIGIISANGHFTSFRNFDPEQRYSYSGGCIWYFPMQCLLSFVNGGFERFEKRIMDFVEHIDEYTCHRK